MSSPTVPTITIYIPGNLIGVSEEDNKKKPIDYILEKILFIRDHKDFCNILILKAGTGVGKSFVLPVELYKVFNKPNILCVQPTIILAKELSKKISIVNNNIFKIGQNLGFITGNEKNAQNGLIFITTGILVFILRRMLDNLEKGIFDKDSPNFILIDEAHRRPLDMEVSLILLKELKIKMGKKCPFIIFMSATLNEKQIATYYDIKLDNQLIEISGSTSIRVNTYLDTDLNDIYLGIVDRLKEIINNNFDDILEDAIKKNKKITGGGKSENYDDEGDEILMTELYLLDDNDIEYKFGGKDMTSNGYSRDKRMITDNPNPKTIIPNDILIFCPTNKFINVLFFKILKWIESNNIPAIILSLTSKSYAENSEDVMWLDRELSNYLINGKPIERRIILSTNVAETGLTLPNLKHLLDTGFVNSIEYNPHLSAYCKVQKPTSKDSIIQRIGRVGRIIPGVSHGLYTKNTFDLLEDYNIPEIIKQDFSVEYLLIKKSGVKYENLIDKPLLESIYHIEDKLFGLGFIDNNSNLTKLGEYACSFTRISIENIKLILSGYAFGISLSDLITIVAVIENITLPTMIPINDQFISSLIHFDLVMFKNQYEMDQYVRDNQETLKKLLNILKSDLLFTHNDILNILSTRWDIIKSLSVLGISLDNVPSHSIDLFNFLNEYILTEKILEDNKMLLNNFIKNHPTYKIICNFKRCIYESYKLNTVYRKGSKYFTLKNYEVILPNFFNKEQKNLYSSLGIYRYDAPNIVVCNKFLYEQSYKTNEYNMKTELISIMDGFIGIDLNFFNNITSDSHKELTSSEYEFYNKSLYCGNLIFANNNNFDNKTGGNDEMFTGYYSNDYDIEL
jgi:HrpA-like RNA helicase